METPSRRTNRARAHGVFKAGFVLLGCSVFLRQLPLEAQDRESLAGEKAAQALKASGLAQAQQYNIHYGPLDLQIGGTLRFGYTDNAFYSQTNRQSDFIINPEVDVGGFVQVSELNTLRFSLGVGYEYYTQTPTHIWVHDLDIGTLTEIATRNRMAPFCTPQLLLNDNRILMLVVRNKVAQTFNMDLDGSDAKEFTRAPAGAPMQRSIIARGLQPCPPVVTLRALAPIQARSTAPRSTTSTSAGRQRDGTRPI